jgi:hypothetical protein
MARKQGNSLTGGTGFNSYVKEKDSNINSNINPDVNFKEKTADPLENLQEQLPSKELSTTLRGIYFDNEVAQVIDQQAKRLGRGGKSKLVNDIVKSYFVGKGLL